MKINNFKHSFAFYYNDIYCFPLPKMKNINLIMVISDKILNGT